MKVKSKDSLPSPEVAAKEFIALKAEKIRLEKRLDTLKETLEPFLANFPEKSAELAGWKFSLVETTRESFSLSKALEKIDRRVLRPYISEATYTQIRTTWKGAGDGEE